MIGNNEQASSGKCKYVGNADVFINTESGDLVLRSCLLSKKLEQNELYSTSKGNGTQSIILTLVGKKFLHLDPIDSDGYICMNGCCSNYVNFKEISRSFKEVQGNTRVIQNSASTDEELTAEAYQNVNSPSNNQDEYASADYEYECVGDDAIKSNKSETGTSLQNAITSLLSCCACCVRTG